MNSDIQEAIYCKDDGEYRLNCLICDELSLQRYYKNHLNHKLILKTFVK